jgi:hypothetical protein
MPRKSTKPVPFITGNDTKADTDRRKEVEKLLASLKAAGMPARDARFGLNNTMLKVPAKGGLVRVDLSRTNPSDVLLDMFDAVWKAGVAEGERRERERTASSIMEAFPSLTETLVKIVDDRIAADRAYNRCTEE